MVAPDRVMVRDRSTRGDQRVARGLLDGAPLLDQNAMTPERMEREVRRRAVGIDVGEAAGDLAWRPGRFDDGALGRGFDRVVERL